jgi:DNA-binding XRE family transcriptional regulator
MELWKVSAANLRKLRHNTGISQEDLVHAAGMNRTYISKLEKGVSYTRAAFSGTISLSSPRSSPNSLARRRGLLDRCQRMRSASAAGCHLSSGLRRHVFPSPLKSSIIAVRGSVPVRAALCSIGRRPCRRGLSLFEQIADLRLRIVR